MQILARLGEGDLLKTKAFQSVEDDDDEEEEEEDCNCIFIFLLVGLLYFYL